MEKVSFEIKNNIEYMQGFKTLNEIKLMETVEQKKDAAQQNAVLISRKHTHTVLSWATGVGKSLAAIKIIYDAVKNGDTTKWYIVCLETAHISNWIADFVKHGYKDLLQYVEIFCYASLHKYRETNANLVLDESHSVSDLRLEHLVTIKFNKVVSLSATLSGERQRQLSMIHVTAGYKISMTDAINTGMLPPPTICVVYFDLKDDKSNRDHTFVFKQGYHRKNMKLPKYQINADDVSRKVNELSIAGVNAYTLEIACTEREYYDLLTWDVDNAKQKHHLYPTPGSKKQWLMKGTSRKRFLANTKTTVAKDLVDLISSYNKRQICFAGSVKQADIISGKKNVVHGNVGSKKAAQIIIDFNNFLINSISVVQMLRQGMNLNGIQVGTVVQLDSKELSFVQMMGRIFRSTDPLLFVICVNKTKDTDYLKECTADLDPRFLRYVRTTNIQEIQALLANQKE